MPRAPLGAHGQTTWEMARVQTETKARADMIVILVVPVAFLALVAFGAYAAWSVITQTRNVVPDGPGSDGGGGGGGPAADGPIGGGGPGLQLDSPWTLQDDLDLRLLLDGALRH